MSAAENLFLIMFMLWSVPLFSYRGRFRKMVYRTESWTINFKPVFGKELKALFGNIYPYDKEYIVTRNFYRVYLIVYFLLLAAHLAFGISTTNDKNMEIKVGDIIPGIVLKNQNGQVFNLKKETTGKNVVLFFYPKDDTQGCTKQACSFRDQYEDFAAANAVVIGISGQSVESHKKFAEKNRLSYTLLSDEGNKTRKKFGVPTNLFGLLPGRVTYVIDKQGKVIYIFNSQTRIDDHITKTLEVLKSN